MPELPEIEVLRRSLEPHLPGERIRRVEVRDRRLREPIDVAALGSAVSGRRVVAVGRRAKYLLIHLEGARTVVVHLGMSGRLTLVPGETAREPHEHVAFELASGRRLRLRDPRRFGVVFALPTASLAVDPHFAALGPEPLDGAFSGDHLTAAASRRRGPVKTFLMDAGVVVGVGNIYASEACFRAGVDPRRAVHRIARPRFDRLAAAVVATLEQAIAEGGTTLNDFADAAGQSGYFQVSLAVYGREGEACPSCGTAIRRVVLGGRSTYWCPRCQH